MSEIKARNVNEMLTEALWALRVSNSPVEQTRNGPVRAFDEPVILTYRRPEERVMFSPLRDCNPVFHLMESIWMIAGRNDVAFPTLFNSSFGQFSDDGETFNAAYGHRWRHHFGRDQLVEVIELLRRDPQTRQAVIQMWDTADLTKPTKDKACNMSIVFDRRKGQLNMTVFNRSNDLVWGACGANAVHMSFLQEFVASALGAPTGVYRQASNNMHLYLETYDGAKFLNDPSEPSAYNHYASGEVDPLPIMLNSDYRSFIADCERFCDDPFNGENRYVHPFFLGVAHPMAMISRTRRGKAGTGEGWAAKVKASDWRRAAFEWIQRREKARL